VDLSRSDEERHEDLSPKEVDGMGPDYPWGLCIRLTERELEKLDLDDDVDCGDMIDMRCFGEVTAVHKSGDACCIEIQIQRMSVENEMTEEMGDE
jgi:hypothetical protein